MMCCNIIQCLKYHKTLSIPVMLKVINANSLSCCSLLGVYKLLSPGSRGKGGSL